MNIALVRPFFSASKGGAEWYAVDLARALSEAGHQVHVYANTWDDAACPGAVFHRVPMLRKPAWLRVWTFHRGVRRMLAGADHDLVLGMVPFAPQDVFWLGDGVARSWARAQWPSRPVRWARRLLRTVIWMNSRLERKALEGGASHAVAVSDMIRRQAVEGYCVPAERIHVVHHGIDTRRFSPDARRAAREPARREWDLAGDDLVFAFVSNDFRRKGLDAVLRALARLARGESKARLLVAGSDRRMEAYRRRARRLGVSDRVRFAGPVGGVERVYAASDALVLPVLYDPFGLVVLEAMACGLPAIVSRMCGAAELIEQGVSGFVLDDGKSPDELAERMRLLAGGGTLEAMGAAAAGRAREFDLERHRGEMIRLLERIAGDRRAGRIEVARPEPGLSVNREFLGLLEREGLASHDALMGTDRAEPFVYNRSTKRMFLLKLENEGRPVSLYMKRHRRPRRAAQWLGRLLGRADGREGTREWDNLRQFRDRGLPTIVPVAAGRRAARDGDEASLCVTLGLEGYESLETHLPRRFAPPLDPARRKEKNVLIRAAARLTRNMHWAGFNHRDYYLCHLYVKWREDGTPDLRVIDLARAGSGLRFRRRWIVKDLAALHYSSKAAGLTDRDRLRFFAAYSREFSGRADRRSLARAALAKSALIARHDRSLERKLGPAVPT